MKKAHFYHLTILSILTKIYVLYNVDLLYSYNCLVKIVWEPKNKYFFSHLLTSSWANNQINRDRLIGEKSNLQYMHRGNSYKHKNSKDREATLGVYDV